MGERGPGKKKRTDCFGIVGRPLTAQCLFTGEVILINTVQLFIKLIVILLDSFTEQALGF